MRILQLHSDFIEYEPVKKEIKQAEEAEKKKNRLEEIVVLFTAVEKGDNEATAKKAIDEVKEFIKNLKVNKILIYPYAHLSSDLAKPGTALKVIKKMGNYSKKIGVETHRAPFGWTKKFTIGVKGHPLAEQSKVIAALPKGKEEKLEQKAKRMGKRPAIETEKLSKNDHRVIGQKLDLYSFHEAGPGMVFFHNKGVIIWNQLIDFWRKEHSKRGYQEVSTPIILNKNLWEISGHWDHFKDNMFFTKVEDVDFALKPMNCPGAILIYKTKTRSYRDLPLRLAELGLIHRSELSGVLSGLFRVREFVQDDAHLFVKPEQLKDEIVRVVDLTDYLYKTFGFEYNVELSTKPEKAMGSKKMWDQSEKALKDALKMKKIKYKLNPGEGAFYGPKIDFHIKDSLGRTWQCATVQVDFAMPERFKLTYIGKDGKEHPPVIIHRVIYGSIERFIGILVEHYQGKFPLWLAPIQVRVLPISDENISYSEKVREELERQGIRVDMDSETNTIEYKIRNAALQKIPYMSVIGKKEEKNKSMAIRDRDGKERYGVKLKDFIKEILEEVKNKT